MTYVKSRIGHDLSCLSCTAVLELAPWLLDDVLLEAEAAWADQRRVQKLAKSKVLNGAVSELVSVISSSLR